MAQFIVTDPETGLKLRLTGDSPPTEAELEQIFAGQAPTQEPTPDPLLAFPIAQFARGSMLGLEQARAGAQQLGTALQGIRAPFKSSFKAAKVFSSMPEKSARNTLQFLN